MKVNVERWEQELECLGLSANIAELEKHLACAPTEAPSKDNLQEFINNLKSFDGIHTGEKGVLKLLEHIEKHSKK